MKQDPNLPFTTLLASSTHDMKNILSAALESLDWLYDSSGQLNQEQQLEVEKIIQLLSNVNAELMQLLYFYKFKENKYHLNIKEVIIDDFVKMQQAFFASIVKSDKLTLTVEYDSELIWYFDDVLITSAVRNAIMNALKYAKKQLKLQIIKNSADYLELHLEDDGPGFPEKKQTKAQQQQLEEEALQTNNTGLGLFFATQVAKAHKVNNKQGYITLATSELLQGAKFSIFIP